MTTRHGRKPSACHDKPTGSPRRTTPRGAFFRPRRRALRPRAPPAAAFHAAEGHVSRRIMRLFAARKTTSCSAKGRNLQNRRPAAGRRGLSIQYKERHHHADKRPTATVGADPCVCPNKREWGNMKGGHTGQPLLRTPAYHEPTPNTTRHLQKQTKQSRNVENHA